MLLQFILFKRKIVPTSSKKASSVPVLNHWKKKKGRKEKEKKNGVECEQFSSHNITVGLQTSVLTALSSNQCPLSSARCQVPSVLFQLSSVKCPVFIFKYQPSTVHCLYSVIQDHSEYNALEHDLAVVNLYFGSSSVYGQHNRVSCLICVQSTRSPRG